MDRLLICGAVLTLRACEFVVGLADRLSRPAPRYVIGVDPATEDGDGAIVMMQQDGDRLTLVDIERLAFDPTDRALR